MRARHVSPAGREVRHAEATRLADLQLAQCSGVAGPHEPSLPSAGSVQLITSIDPD
jgi:hypothetical protein